jgi:peptide-methionine (S)-S-oxide reductase
VKALSTLACAGGMALAAAACGGDRAGPPASPAAQAPAPQSAAQPSAPQPEGAPGLRVATFAGGCFWCMEPPFEELDGVVSVVSGYTGGHDPAPHYESVSAGVTGHTEAVQVTFDPARVSYETLLEVFWHNIDPTAADRQFCDVGSQYRSAIFTHDNEQRRLAEVSRQALERSGRIAAPIVTQIVPAGPFHPAEPYHQDYYKKNPVRYRFYRASCGRDRDLERIWGKSDKHR